MEYRCYDCKETKPQEEFSKRTASAKNPRPVQNSCRTCNNARVKAWRAANKDKFKEQQARSRKNQRVGRYGLTAVEYDAMVEAQGGRCLICGEEPSTVKGLAIDHCHDTGKSGVCSASSAM